MQLIYKYPFVFLTSALILGLLISTYLSIYLGITLVLVGLSLLLTRLRLVTLSSCLSVLGLGIIVSQLSSVINQSHTVLSSDKSIFEIEISGKKKYSNFEQWQVTVKNDSLPTKALLSVYEPSDYKVGDVLLVSCKFKLIAQPSIPDQFSFKEYQARKHVFHQAYINDLKQVKKIDEVISWKTYLQSFRQYLGANLSTSFKQNEEGVLRALVIGDKSHVSTHLKQDYTTSGVIHVLAVSGLHVGFFYLLLSFLLKRINNKWVYVSLLMIGLFLYAGLTGFSASVTRASFMFFFFGVAKILQRNSNSVNVLFASSFFILIAFPQYIYDAGFQLSVVAVLGIALLFEKIDGLVNSKYLLINKLWSGISVSFVAQLFTAPLIVYYFHQLPVYFLLSNLVVLIFIQIALLFGFIVAVIGDVSAFTYIAEQSIIFINFFTGWVSRLPFSKIDGLWLDEKQVIGCYLLLLGFLLFWFQKKRIYAFSAVGALFFIVFVSFSRERTFKDQHYIVLHRLSGQLILEETNGNSSKVKVFGNEPNTSKIVNALSNNWARRNVSDATYFYEEQISVIGNRSIGQVKKATELFFDYNILKTRRAFKVLSKSGEEIFSSYSPKSHIIKND